MYTCIFSPKTRRIHRIRHFLPSLCLEHFPFHFGHSKCLNISSRLVKTRFNTFISCIFSSLTMIFKSGKPNRLRSHSNIQRTLCEIHRFTKFECIRKEIHFVLILVKYVIYLDIQNEITHSFSFKKKMSQT